MVVLKKSEFTHKVRGSTLMETLVATVLIVLIYILASLILNNVFSNTIKNNTQAIVNYLNQLQYFQQYNQIQIPYVEFYENWNITIEKYKENNQSFIEFEATNSTTNKTIRVIKSDY